MGLVQPPDLIGSRYLFVTTMKYGVPRNSKEFWGHHRIMCLVHMVRHSLNYVSWKQRKEVAAAPKTTYQAPTVEEAEIHLEEFEEKRNGSQPSIADLN